MKKFGAVLILATLAIILFTAVPNQVKFFLGGFGIIGGLVLIGLSGYTGWD